MRRRGTSMREGVKSGILVLLEVLLLALFTSALMWAPYIYFWLTKGGQG